MRVGLVLEGGGMRGMYTGGVLDVFLDEDVRVDGVMGVSAGVLFGANLLSRQRGRALRYNKRFTGDPRYMSVRSLLTTGDFVSKDFAYYGVTKEFDPFDEAAFERSGIPFTAVVTNVLTGEAEYIDIVNLIEQLEVIRATAALPCVSRMVRLGDALYLDGGLADSIPVRAMMARGYDKLIAVLTRPASYRKKPSRALAVRLFYARYPNLCRTIRTRPERYNAQCDDVAQLEREGKIFVIRPKAALDIARLEKDPERMQAVYDVGVADARETMASLRAYLRA